MIIKCIFFINKRTSKRDTKYTHTQIYTLSNEGRLSSTIFVHLIFFSLYQNDDVRTLT